jgi:hypothetical protein
MIAELTLTLTLGGQPPTPYSTPAGAPPLCNFAKVYHLRPGNRIEVYASPDARSANINTLPTNAVVYTCDETKDWYKVFYGSPGKPCRAGTPNGLPETQKMDCQSGWVRKKWIDVLSG